MTLTGQTLVLGFFLALSGLLGACSHAPPASTAASGGRDPRAVTGKDTRPPPAYLDAADVRNIDNPSASLRLSDPLDSASIIDRALARHKRDRLLLAKQTADARQSPGPKVAGTRHSKPYRAGKQGAGHDSNATSVAEVSMTSGEACSAVLTEPSRGRRKPRKSAGESASRCQVAQRDFMGPPDLRATQMARARRGGDAWATVRGGLLLAGIQHERLDAHLEHLRQHPGAVDFLMNRAEPYLPYLLGEIKRQGLPSDLILVPMVENAFQTTALSPKQAAGLWQFIPSTGQQYGLQLSENYDGRYDTHPATQAALKYLKHLNNLFSGDWLLAFAAYNAGEGAVQRAIEANRLAGGSGTFWELSLPSETQNYVVKIVALSKVVADPAGNGFKPHQPSVGSALARVETKPEVHIADLIASSGIAPDEFYKLNPAFKPDVEPPPQPHNFLLPLEKAEILMAANMQGAKVYAPRRVVVKKGETLTQLAKRHGVPEFKLAEWNGLTLKSPLKAGQEILVLGV